MEEVPMSVLGILLHFSRAVIQAHNNAKVRNLMDAPPPREHTEAGEEGHTAEGHKSLSRHRHERRSR
jgi:hypothetical protein